MKNEYNKDRDHKDGRKLEITKVVIQGGLLLFKAIDFIRSIIDI